MILCLFSSPTSELEDYMSDRVQFVITAQEWDPSFEEVSPRGAGRGRPNPPLHPLHPLLTCPTCTPPHPAGLDGQPLPGVCPPTMDLQLQREAEVTSPPALWGGAPGLRGMLTTCVHTPCRKSLIKVTWFGAAAPATQELPEPPNGFFSFLP